MQRLRALHDNLKIPVDVTVASGNHQLHVRLSRRTLLAGTAGTLLATTAIRAGLQSPTEPPAVPPPPGPDIPLPPLREPTIMPPAALPTRQATAIATGTAVPVIPEPETPIPPGPVFDDPETNEIARKIGISIENFFNTSNEIYPRLSAFKDEKELLPIYPPSIYTHKDLIYKMARQYDIPVNVLATIMTVESTGDTNAKSVMIPTSKDVERRKRNNPDLPLQEMNSWGFMQIFDENFYAAGIQQTNHMTDPEINMRYGIKIYKEFLTASRNHWAGAPESKIWIRALMGYNGGYDAITSDFADVPAQSQWYSEHMHRYFVTAQVASELRKKGYDNATVLKKLASREINARVAAYTQYIDALPDDQRFRFKDYQETMDVLGQSTVSKKTTPKNLSRLVDFYNNARNHPPVTEDYINPALRMHNAAGGSALYNKVPENNAFTGREKIDTSIPEIKNAVPLFDQKDPRWAVDETWSSGSACAPTTLAMILRKFGDTTETPATIDRQFQKENMRIRPGKTADTFFRTPDPNQMDAVTWLVKYKKYEVNEVSEEVHGNRPFTFEKAKKYLDQGYLLVASANPSWVAKGVSHIFGISEVDVKNKTFTTFDPWGGVAEKRVLAELTPPKFWYVYAMKPK